MDNKDWYDCGAKIGDLVNRAIDSDNYRALSSNIAEVIGESLDAIQKNLAQQAELQKRAKEDIDNQDSWKRQGNLYQEAMAKRKPAVPAVRRSGRGILSMVLGYMTCLVFSGVTLTCMLLSWISDMNFFMLPAGMTIMAALGGFLIGRRGSKIREQLKLEWTAQDRLAKMDEQMAQAKREPQSAQSKADVREKMENYSEETRKILADGDAFIRHIHHANELIPGEVMTQKLSRLEAVVTRIFSQVAASPDSAPDLHRMMEYYLPTTRKLIDAYCELDRQQIAGENIENTKKEIEDSLDTINQAFETFLDGFFQDTAWDIETDIRTLKTMMARDGLVGDDLHK